jgi:hypothetical protein
MVELRTRFEQAVREQDAGKLRALTSEIKRSRREDAVPAPSSSLVRRKERLSPTMEAKALLENHRLHLGLYKRVADATGVHASFVSKVASGKRESITVMRVLLKELRKLEQQSFANGRHNDDPSAKLKGVDTRNGSGGESLLPTSWNVDIAS